MIGGCLHTKLKKKKHEEKEEEKPKWNTIHHLKFHSESWTNVIKAGPRDFSRSINFSRSIYVVMYTYHIHWTSKLLNNFTYSAAWCLPGAARSTYIYYETRACATYAFSYTVLQNLPAGQNLMNFLFDSSRKYFRPTLLQCIKSRPNFVFTFNDLFARGGQEVRNDALLPAPVAQVTKIQSHKRS